MSYRIYPFIKKNGTGWDLLLLNLLILAWWIVDLILGNTLLLICSKFFLSL